MNKLEECLHCGEERENCYHGFISMGLPIPEAEALIEKWSLIDAYKRYSTNSALAAHLECFSQEEFINKIKTDSEFSKKWYTKDWWKNLERTDLTEQEMKELDDLGFYDQMLNTVGRGVQCDDCGKREAELYEKYYPENK